jgi:hypothetical protein
MTPQVGTREAVMDWARMLAYVTGTVDQELLARNMKRRSDGFLTKRGEGSRGLRTAGVASAQPRATFH